MSNSRCFASVCTWRGDKDCTSVDATVLRRVLLSHGLSLLAGVRCSDEDDDEAAAIALLGVGSGD